MQTATQLCPDATRALFARLCAAYPDIAAQLTERLSATPATSSADSPNAATLVFQEEKMGQTVTRLDALTRQSKESQAPPPPFPPLESVTRPTVPTEQAGYYLDRRPQTMRMWAMRDGTGPIRPLRINGRLAWPVAELRRVLGV